MGQTAHTLVPANVRRVREPEVDVDVPTSQFGEDEETPERDEYDDLTDSILQDKLDAVSESRGEVPKTEADQIGELKEPGFGDMGDVRIGNNNPSECVHANKTRLDCRIEGTKTFMFRRCKDCGIEIPMRKRSTEKKLRELSTAGNHDIREGHREAAKPPTRRRKTTKKKTTKKTVRRKTQ